MLASVRPLAGARVRQPVRIVVRRPTLVDAWAVVEGELVGAANRSVNWSLASECEPELDKILFALLHRERSAWRVSQLAVCDGTTALGCAVSADHQARLALHLRPLAFLHRWPDATV